MADLSDDNNILSNSSRKRKKHPEMYKNNIIKSARLKGEEYINYRGAIKPPKTPGFTCKCKKMCLKSIGEENCMDSYNKFYRTPTKYFNCTCEGLNLKIKSSYLNESSKRAAVGELIVHKRKSKKIYSALQYETSEDGKKEKHVLALAFDFMQNISLPKVPVQELFYLRQITVNVFCITNIKEKKSTLYIYHEGNGYKGPDEVCSFLQDYLNNIPDNVKELRLFSDNCSAQNKNQTLCRYLLSLTDSGRFDKIQQFFPVRGHSFLPCDRDFGIIKRRLKKFDRIYSLKEIAEHIVESGQPGKFQVNIVEASEIKDYKNWWKHYFKKTVVSLETQQKSRNERIYFMISTLFHFVFEKERKGYVRGYTTINGITMHTFQLAITRHQEIKQTSRCAYLTGKVPIKKSKMKDFSKLLKYVPQEYYQF